jgi:putative protein-disulfide isomerase
MKDQKVQNPLLCDPDSGICLIPAYIDSPDLDPASTNAQAQVNIDYFTDPICSTCWGVEPQLKKLKLEYGHVLHIEYYMGGLLPSWDVYNSGGISKPSDVAHHWDEVSAYYQMPIDGDIWLENPLNSSYPPSIGFKAAQMQSKKVAIHFLRKLREQLFLQKVNITSEEVMVKTASACGLDTSRFRNDFRNNAEVEFKSDLQRSRQGGVRGFPTFFFSNKEGKKEMIYGFRDYSFFENAIKKLYPQAEVQNYEKTAVFLFETFETLTTKEYAVLAEITFDEAEDLLQNLFNNGTLDRTHCKNGDLYSLKK